MTDPPLWRNRDFLLLWTGQVVSTVGTRVSAVAFPLLVLAITGSPAQAGLVGFAQGLPFALCYLPAGALVDRWDRRRTMLTADAVRSGGLASVAVAVAADVVSLPHLMVVGFLEGSLLIFFQLAETAALPHVVTRGQLPTAMATSQAREQGAELAGGPLGGLLFGLAAAAPFVFDAVSYAVSFVALLFLRTPLQTQREPAPWHLVAEIREGVRWLVGLRLLRTLAVLIGVTNLVFSALLLTLIVRATDLGAEPSTVGLMFGLYGAGAVLGALVTPWLCRRVPARVVLLGTLWWWVITTTVLALMPAPLLLGLVAGASALASPLFNVVVGRYRYAMVPDRLQARVTGAARLVAWGPIPLGSLLGGVALETAGAETTLVALVLGMLVIAVVASATRIMRTAPAPDSLTVFDKPPIRSVAAGRVRG